MIMIYRFQNASGATRVPRAIKSFGGLTTHKMVEYNKMQKSEVIERKFREGKLTKRQYDKMLAHCEHHTLKHIRAMLGSLESGASFKKAHDEAMGTVGK